MRAANPRRVLSTLADALAMLRELLARRRDQRDVGLVDLANAQPVDAHAIRQGCLGSQGLSEMGGSRWAGYSFMDGARDREMRLYGSARVRRAS